jgi:hypothetical protein
MRFRAALLHLLGYGCKPIYPTMMGTSPHGSVAYAEKMIRLGAHHWLPLGVELDVRARRVPEVARGTLRVVIEEHAP